jgi:ribosome-dependent ATPase
MQNLVLDARLYHIPPDKAKTRIDELVAKFGLGPYLDALAGDLPMGLRQRLSLAVAVLHEPQMLILDEPTSGVDPVARDSFWELLIDLSRKQGVTIFVTTHFMNEAMRCDRISLMHAGKVLAADAPQMLIDARGAATLEEAFIGYMEDAIGEGAAGGPGKEAPPAAAPVKASAHAARAGLSLRLGRLLAYSANETMQILRDPVRLAFAFIGSALLMLVFGFGISFDVEHVRYATFDLDQTPESRVYLEQFAGAPRYFRQMPPVRSVEDALHRMQSDSISLVLEIPPNFGRDLRKAAIPEVLAEADGADTFRGETITQYVQSVQDKMLRDPANELQTPPQKYTANFQDRYMYNPTFESVYAMAPSIPPILLILIPAILMAISVVREKELGSIINFYVTPTGRLEYLLGKQLPYIVIGMINYFILVAMALVVFAVPIKGSFLVLTLCTLLYVTATTGVGMVISTFTSSQVAAVFVTTVLTMLPTIQFSGFMQPVSTLLGRAKVLGSIWPTTYYMHASKGVFTKGLGLDLWAQDLIVLACIIPILWAVSALALEKQEK